MKQTETKTFVRERIGIAHAISVGIYLFTSVSIASILGGIALQFAFNGPFQATGTSDSTNTVSLSWTAPGDDGNFGTAASYTVRYASEPLSESNWSTATNASNPPIPLVAGSNQAMTVTGLNPGVLYYFGIKTQDETGNISPISNVASKRTALFACLPQWSCTDWTVCRNSQQTRLCLDTKNPSCNSSFNMPLTAQTCSTPMPAPTVCTPNWSCSDWSACSANRRTRVCQDRNVCGNNTSKPETDIACSGSSSSGVTLPSNPAPHYFTSVTAKGGEPRLRVFNALGKSVGNVLVYKKTAKTGLSVAGGDLDGDGQGDVVVGTGPGTKPEVSLYTVKGKLRKRFYAFPSKLRTGVNVAVGDVDGDGHDDLIVAPASAYPPIVRIYRFNAPNNSFVRLADISTHGGRFRGGLNVEAGDLDRNGLANIVVTAASKGRGSTVEMYEYDLLKANFKKISSFTAYTAAFKSGLVTAIGDVDGDGNNELMTAPATGVADVRVFAFRKGRAVRSGGFRAGSASFKGGVDLAALDMNRDGRDEVITANYSNGNSSVLVFSKNYANTSYKKITSPFPKFLYSSNFLKGVRIGAL